MRVNFDYDRNSLPAIARAKRVARRFFTRFGQRGLTGKQAAAYDNLPNEVRCRAELETINRAGVARLTGGFQRRVRINFYRTSGELIASHMSDACTYTSDRPSQAVTEVPTGTAFIETEWRTFGNQSREGGRVYRYTA